MMKPVARMTVTDDSNTHGNNATEDNGNTQKTVHMLFGIYLKWANYP